MKKEIIKDPVKEMDELSLKLKEKEKEKPTKKQQVTIKDLLKEKFIKY